jgi:hypothetical protein
MPWKLAPMTARKWAACHAFAHWVGETCIGLIPLLAFVIMHNYATSTLQILSCPAGAKLDFTIFPSCSPLSETISQEACILTVVISGLAVLSLFNFGPKARKAPITAFSFILIVFAILALLAGALLYALFGVHIDKDAQSVTWGVLGTALFSSLFLAIEGAVLDA